MGVLLGTHCHFTSNGETQMTPQEKLEAAQKQLQEVQAQLEEAKQQIAQGEQWEPKTGKWWLLLNNHINFEVEWDTGTLSGVNDSCRHFPTKESAVQAAKVLRAQLVLSQLAADLNGDWVFDWDNSGQGKHPAVYSAEDKAWFVGSAYTLNSFTAYFKDVATARRACEILNNQPELIQL